VFSLSKSFEIYTQGQRP